MNKTDNSNKELDKKKSSLLFFSLLLYGPLFLSFFFTQNFIRQNFVIQKTKKTNDNDDDGDKGFNKQKMLNLAENFFDLINWKKITDYTVKTDESQAFKNIFMIIGK